MKTYEIEGYKPGVVYYIVDDIPFYNWDRIKRWCKKTFGEQGEICCFEKRWQFANSCLYFSNDADRTWFLLRWS